MARSLGTLTVDLIAKVGGFTQGMTQAERVADKKSREIQKNMEARAKEIDAAWTNMSLALAVGMAGLGTMVTKVVSNAGEIANLASIAGATTTEFQRMAAGASMVGIQQDKLGDQLKDFTEKVGEFQATGGGGMKDFFEQIAPKVGITAEAFRGLSGPQALQLYYDSLEKAGLSQQQMSFYLESMASDTTALIPLLANGGKMMGELGDAAQATGAVMDEKTIKAAQVLQVQMGVLKQQGEGLVNQLTSAMLPTLSGLAGEFSKVTVDGSLAAQAGDVFATSFKAVAAVAVGTYGSVRLLGKALGGLAAMADVSLLEDMSLAERLTPLGAIKGIKNLATYGSKLQQTGAMGLQVFADLDAEAQRIGETINNITGAGAGGSGSSDWAERLVNERQALASALRGSNGATIDQPGKTKSGKTQAEKDAEASESFLQSMRAQVFKSQERTAWEQLHFDIQNKGLKLTEKQLGEAQGLATLADLRTEEAKKLSAHLDEQNHLYQLQERLMSAQQRHQLEMLTYGMGDQAAQELRERIALQQQQQAELRQMQQKHGEELRSTEKEEEQKALQAKFESRYKQTQAALAEELRLFDEAAKQKQAKEKDWLAGAKAGMDTYARDASNAYDQSKRLAQNAFQGMEDALVGMVMTGKADFKGLASSIISDLTRIQMRAQLSGLFSRVFGVPQLASSGITVGGVDGMNGYAGGGYTGPGGKYDPAGIVHRGEGVLSQDDMAAMGGPRAFEAFRASLHRGYASGGVVGAAATVAAATGRAGLEVNVHNYAGAQIEQRRRTGPDGQAILDIVVKEVAAQVIGNYGPMGQAMRQRDRNGG